MRPLVPAALVAGLGGSLFGYDTAVINGANQYLRLHFSLDAVGEGFAGASAIIGCIPGACGQALLRRGAEDRFKSFKPALSRLLVRCLPPALAGGYEFQGTPFSRPSAGFLPISHLLQRMGSERGLTEERPFGRQPRLKPFGEAGCKPAHSPLSSPLPPAEAGGKQRTRSRLKPGLTASRNRISRHVLRESSGSCEETES